MFLHFSRCRPASLVLVSILLGSFCHLALAQEIELPVVNVKTRDSALETTTSSSVVEVADTPSPAETVGDTISTLPGVRVSTKGPGQAQTVSIRGSSSSQVTVWLQGIPIGDPRGGGPDLSSIPLSAVDSIEVYRGSRGAFTGNGSLAGAVVIRLKTDANPCQNTSLGYGSWNQRTVGIEMIRGGILAVYGHSSSDGDFEFRDTNGRYRTRTNNTSSSDRLLLHHSLEFANGATLGTTILVTTGNRGSPGLEQFPSSSGQEARNEILAGTELTWPAMPLLEAPASLSASWSLHDWSFKDVSPYMPPPVDTGATTQRFRLAARVESSFPVVRPLIDLSCATEWGQLDGLQSSNPSPLVVSFDTLAAASAYLGSFTLVGGVRTSYSNRWGLSVMPSIEGSWKPLDWFTLSALASRSSRLPQFDEMYFMASGITGNPNLEPETSWSADLTLRIEFPWIAAEASAFYQLVDNSILFLPKSPYLVQAQNTGAIDVYGVEAAVAVEYSLLTSSVTASWNHGVLAETGAPKPLSPEVSATWEGTIDYGPGTVYLRTRAQSRFNLDRFGSRSEEARILLDAGATVEPGLGLLVRVDAVNLTNKMDAIDYFQYPLGGFSIFVSINKSWR